jgi:hypothetical protein
MRRSYLLLIGLVVSAACTGCSRYLRRQDAAVGNAKRHSEPHGCGCRRAHRRHLSVAVAANTQPPGADYLVFVHFQGRDGELLWTDDHQPERPLAQWKAGDTIEYTRTVFVPKVSYVGPIAVNVGIYLPKTGDRLPLSGEDGRDARVSRGPFNIREAGNDVFLVFKSGWHDAEVADAASGIEWQWSKKEGLLSFRNPKREVELFLDVDQPVPSSRRRSTWSFASVPRCRQLRPAARPADAAPARLNPAQLGSAETVELGVAVDRTLVPASIPALKSGDSRELGIRVFHAYVEPK